VLEIGQVIDGKYKLLRLLGDGGMGSVYEAEHLALGTHVAIKVLHPDLARRTGIAERFLQEARVSAQIRSQHVVQVTDVDRTPEGVAYLVMELLQGEPLSSVIKRERTLPVATACEYVSQILQALEAAHALGVIHRDLKPDNVFVTFQGGKPVLKLIDFGIAKLKTAQAGQTRNLTVAGMLMGTPEYMAPEQAYSADKVDVRADLYAVGVMFYEMLSGKPPAEADDPRVLILKVERGEVTPLVQAVPGIQPEIAGFAHRAMAPRPELRFATATEMRLALEAIVSGKRAGTAKMPSIGAAAPPAPSAAAAAEPPAQEAKTGTVMGAPVEAALATTPNAAMGSGPPPPGIAASGGTVGAPPIAPVMSPLPSMPYEPSHLPQQGYADSGSREKGGTGLIVALAIIALLLGAGAVVAYVLGTQGSTPDPILPPPTLATATTVTPATPAMTTTTVSVTPVTPLTTAPIQPSSPSPAPGPTAKRDAGGGGGGGNQAQEDAGVPPSPLPLPPAPTIVDAGGGQTTIVTPFGTFQFPGPRPPFYPPDQPWPPPTFGPMPTPP
jgi:serine/threonine-protein kinase